jgi:hypothetical protein
MPAARQSAVAGNARADAENSKLTKEVAQLKVRNQELTEIVNKLTVEKEAQKETLRENHLSAVNEWRTRYTTLEAYHAQFAEKAAAKEMAMQKQINQLTEDLDLMKKNNDDLTWKLKKAEDELNHTRALALSAVQHQFKMLSGMFQVYKQKSLGMGFNHWESVCRFAKQQREMDTLRLQLKIAAMGSGVRLLDQIFKRWQNREIFGGFNGMRNNFRDEYSEYLLQKKMKEMGLENQKQALAKLNRILNVWLGKACARELFNLRSGWMHDKRVAHMSAIADKKLAKLRQWKGFGEWQRFVSEAKDRKHDQEFESMKKQIADLKDELAKAELEMERLMEKYLGARHSAFFDKIDRIMKAWRFGTFGLAFSDWTRWAKDQKKWRLENAGKVTQEELLASLKANELEIAGLKKKIALLEAEAAESTQAISVRDNEIAMLKEKVRALEARNATLYDQGFAEGNKDKEEALGVLMKRFLLAAQGAFLDKVNEILKAWQFGSYGYMFSTWKTEVSAAKRPAANQADRIEQLEAKLAEANKTIASLQAQLEANEAASLETQRAHELKIKELHDTIEKLHLEVSAAQAAKEAAEQKLEKELAFQAEQHKKKIAELTEDVTEAQEAQIKAQNDAKTAQTEKSEALREITNLKAQLETQAHEALEKEKEAARELDTVNTRLKKSQDKAKLQEDALSENETLRKEMQDHQLSLVEENKKLTGQMVALQGHLESERKESAAARESQRVATKDKASAEAKDKKIAELSDKSSKLESEVQKKEDEKKAVEKDAEDKKKLEEKAAANAAKSDPAPKADEKPKV